MTLRPPESPWPPDAAVSEHRIGSQSDLRRSVLESDALSRFWRRPPSRAPARRSAGRTLLGFADASGSRWSSPGQSSDGSGSDSQDAMPEVRQRPRRRTPPLTHSASGGQLTDMPARRRRWTWQALSAPLPHPPSPGEMTDGSDRSDSRGSTPEERQTHLRERALQRQRRWTPPLGLWYNSLAGAQLPRSHSQPTGLSVEHPKREGFPKEGLCPEVQQTPPVVDVLLSGGGATPEHLRELDSCSSEGYMSTPSLAEKVSALADEARQPDLGGPAKEERDGSRARHASPSCAGRSPASSASLRDRRRTAWLQGDAWGTEDEPRPQGQVQPTSLAPVPPPPPLAPRARVAFDS